MRIRRISAENFLSHEKEEIALPEQGLFFLDGPSGSGKSSFIVDAPLYALFGPRATRGKQEELRHLDYPDETMKVEVVFEFDNGELLVVERGVNEKGKAYATASAGEGRLLAENPAAVDREVRHRLGGMSWQQLKAAFVCHQKEVAALTDLKPADRKKLIHRLLGIKELELAQTQTNDDLKEAKADLERVAARVGERTKQGEETRLKELEREATKATKRRGKIEKELTAANKGLQKLVETTAPLEAAERAAEDTVRLKAQIGQREHTLKELQKQLAKQEGAEKRLKEEGPQLEVSLREAQIELERLRGLGERTGQRAQLLESQREATERISQTKAALEALPVAVPEEISTRLAVIGAERRSIAEQLARGQDDILSMDEKGVCAACRRPLPEGKEREALIANVKNALGDLQKREEGLAKEDDTLQESLPTAQKQAKAHKDAELKVTRADEALTQINTQLATLEKEGVGEDLEALRGDYKAQDEKIQAIQKHQGALSALREGLDEGLTGRVRGLEGEQGKDREALAKAGAAASVSVDAATLAKLRSEINQARQTVGECTGQLAPAQAEEARLSNEHKEVQKELAKFQSLLDERERHHQRALHLERLFDYLDAFTRYLAAEIRPAIEEMATEMIYQMSGGRFVGLRIDEDYNIEIQRDEGNWIKPTSLSGGEEVRANLSLRLALTRLVSQRTGVPVRFIVLDEPFGNLDPELIDVSMGLLDSLRSFYPQIFVISHTGDMASNQHVDYRLAFESHEGRERIALYQR
jgi:exonuclease SbcC